MEFPLLFSLIILLTVFIALKFFKRSRAPNNLPPGPPKLPFIGNLHQLAMKASVPHRRLAELARVYGPIMQLQLGEFPTIVISSADMASEVMKTHDAAFCSRPMLMAGKVLAYDSKDIGLAPYGEYWRQVRKIATLELFTAKRVESFRPIRMEEVDNLVASIASEAGSVVNLSNKLFGLTFDITSRQISKETLNKKDQEASRALVAATVEVASGFSVADIYPSLEWLHLISGMKKKLQKIIEGMDRLLDPIVEKHKRKQRQSYNQVEDLVDVLFKFHRDNVHEADQFSLTTNNIKAITIELLGAGSETSSSVLEWAMSELLKNPKVMEKVQHEVRQVYQERGVVDETKLDDLKYMKLVIKETLRLHPPLPFLVPRESLERCQIQGYEIPSKTRVLINVWAIGRDLTYWSEPHKFIPERFEESSIDYKGTNFELIPFGAGRRRCPGMNLGMANVELPLAKQLYHFDWKLPSPIKQPEDLDMDESFGLTMRRKNELLVIPIPYP